MLAGPPTEPVPVPGAVQEIADGRRVEVVWVNGLGGLTFRLSNASEAHYLKWAPVGTEVDLERERVKLEWAIRYTPVPRVVDSGGDDEGAWLLTEAIGGESTVSDRWKADPRRAVVAIGQGLRSLHDCLPVDGCPFSWSTRDRIAAVERRVAGGLVRTGGSGPGSLRVTAEDALAVLRDPPPAGPPVVCHGDACAPNTLVDGEGRWVAHVDLERLGTGDRWADLAVAAWSTDWNFGPGWEGLVYESYGVRPDQERIDYFRLLWAVG